MNQKIEEILDLCLTAMKKGESLETCLSRYPEHAAVLRPLIEMAQRIQTLPVPEPSQQDLHELLVRIGSFKKGGRKKESGRLGYWFPSVQPVLFRLAVTFLVLLVMGVITVSLSANSLPGTPLYPIKLFTEKIQFFLTRNSEGKAELRIIFSEKRIEELLDTYNRDKSIDRELLNATLNEAKLALDGISEYPENQKDILLTKLYHLNAYQNDVLEQIKVTTNSDDKEVIGEAINLCRQRGEWMRERWMRPPSESKPGTQRNENSPWGKWCRWR